MRLLAALATIAFSVIPAQAETRTCKIAEISNGKGSLVRQDEILRKPIGLLIEPGDRLRKTSSAQILITCSDGGEITVGRATKVDLGAIIAAPLGEPRVFRVLRGIAGFVMPSKATPVEIQTFNAVASVRSTEWTVEVEGDVTHVFVREGLVQVKSKDGETTGLSDGEGVTVLADGTLGPVKAWGQGRIDKMNERLGSGWR